MSTKAASKWSSRKQCSAVNCKNYPHNTAHVAFHRFPKDPDRCAKWVQNLKNPSLKDISSEKLHQSYRVCSAHFDTSQFKRSSDVHAGLKWNAVPTDQNSANTTVVASSSESVEEDEGASEKVPCSTSFSCKLIKEEPPSPVIVSVETVKEEKEQPSPVVFANTPLKREEVDKPPYPAVFNIKSIKEEEDEKPSPVVLCSETIKKEEEATELKYEPSDCVDSSSYGGVTVRIVKDPDDSKADITEGACVSSSISDVSVGGPAMSQTPLLTPKSETEDLEAAARVRALKRKNNHLSQQVIRLKAKQRELRWLNKMSRAGVKKVSVMMQLRKLLPWKTYAFVKTQILVSRCKADGFPWSSRDKAFFLSMLHASPTLYRLLLQVFSMPSIKALKRLMK